MYPLCLGVSIAAQEAPKVPTTPVSKSLQTRGPPPSKRHVSFPWKKVVVRNTNWIKHRTFTIFSVIHYILQYHKGQLISECLFGVLSFPKNQRKISQIFAPESKKWSNHRIMAPYSVFNTSNSPYNHRIIRKCLYLVDLTTFKFLGQKFVKFFVVFLENLKTSKRHSETIWPLEKKTDWFSHFFALPSPYRSVLDFWKKCQTRFFKNQMKTTKVLNFLYPL